MIPPTPRDMTPEQTEAWIDEYWPRIRRLIEVLGHEDLLAEFEQSDHPVSQAIAARIRKFVMN